MRCIICWRVYQNFIMPSRLQEYSQLLHAIKHGGYEFLTLCDYVRRIGAQRPLPARTCLLRNDVDSDPSTAFAMFEEERKLGVKGTYYFRMSTLNPDVMRSIQAHGSEVGYHYEELATIAKRFRLRDRNAVMKHIDLVRDEFRANMRRFADAAGFMPTTIASHGDFANHMLKVPNTELIDAELRSEFGIVVEAYDPILEKTYDARIIDRELPVRWSPETPFQAIERGAGVMRILVHPRQWRCNRSENLRQDLIRIVEGVRFKA